MPLRSAWFTVALLLAAAGPAAAQSRPYLPPETAEPPLADGGDNLQPAAGRAPAPLTPGVRFVDATAPVVQLAVRMPPTHATGTNLDVRLAVENVSRTPAKHVVVVLPILKDAQVAKAVPDPVTTPDGLTWKIDELPAGGRREFVVTLTPHADVTELECRARVLVTHEQAAKTRLAKPDLRLKKTGPEQALRHDVLVFAVDVTNAGAAELTGVTVTDPLPEGLEHRPDDKAFAGSGATPPGEVSPDKKARTWKLDRLAPGQTRRLEYYVAATGGAGTVAAT